MKTKKRLSTLLCITAVSLLIGMTAAAAPKAESISIEDSKRVLRVGQKLKLDSEILPDEAEVRDRNIIWTSSNPKVLRVLEKRDDDTKIKALKAGKAKITVRIKGTKLSASRTFTVKKKTNSSASDLKSKYTKKIDAQAAKAAKYEAEISSLQLPTDFTERRVLYYTWENKLDKVSNALDVIEDDIEDDYHAGKISRAVYRSLDRKTESAEDYVDEVEDILNQVFQYEFDD
ncbi:MAG: Ig-like domain-containing protein [Lachnospiraceae bacterium]|jgi:hypothetical protein|nr:Ig-like domain-containing protein [Lachnospiraceae bacterium]